MNIGLVNFIKGGPGSGNFGHQGRPGQVGGSGSGLNTGNESLATGNESPASSDPYFTASGLIKTSVLREWNISGLAASNREDHGVVKNVLENIERNHPRLKETLSKLEITQLKFTPRMKDCLGREVRGTSGFYEMKSSLNPEGSHVTILNDKRHTFSEPLEKRILRIGCYTIAGSNRETILMHELGHHFAHAKGKKLWEEWDSMVDKLVKEDPDYMHQISTYAAAKTDPGRLLPEAFCGIYGEGLAESFAAYIHPRYKGELPKPIHDFMAKHVDGITTQKKKLGLASILKGGAGSGNFGHSGRPGQVGGSDTDGGLSTGLANPVSSDAKNRAMAQCARLQDGRLVLSNGKPIPEHIAKLKVPPAWTNVTVSLDPNADILVRGRDSKGRIQMVMSEAHNIRMSERKFAKVQDILSNEDKIIKENEKNLAKAKEEAAVTKLILTTGIRPGDDYKDPKAKVEAFGATTLEGRHVVIGSDGKVHLKFIGKKGVSLDIPVEDRMTATILMNRAKKVGAKGKIFDTDAVKLREYVGSLNNNKGYYPKDFRTALGTKMAMQVVSRVPKPKNEKEYKKAIKVVATEVAKKLGNTPTVALNSYIDPKVFTTWR